jgi:hypothetical protein
MEELLWDDNEDIFRKNVKKWALKNHPDKNPNSDVEIVKNVFQCRDKYTDIQLIKPYAEIIFTQKDLIISLQKEIDDNKNSIEKCNNLGSLYFKNNKQLEENIKKLEESFENCNKLGSSYFQKTKELENKLINLSHINDKYIEKINKLEKSFNNSLSNNSLSNNSLSNNSSSNNSSDLICEERLIDFVNEKTLKDSIDFSRCNFKDNHISYIIKGLEKNSQITKINLDKNNFTDKSAISIFEYLINNITNVKILFIHENCYSQKLIDYIILNYDRINNKTILTWIWIIPNQNCNNKLNVEDLNNLFKEKNSKISIGYGYNKKN